MAITFPEYDLVVGDQCLYYPTEGEFEGAQGDTYPAMVLRVAGYDLNTNVQLCDLIVFTEVGTFNKQSILRKDAGEINPGYFSNTVPNIMRNFKDNL
jgi:hypothetical protein